jgi:hypothetical protein
VNQSGSLKYALKPALGTFRADRIDDSQTAWKIYSFCCICSRHLLEITSGETQTPLQTVPAVQALRNARRVEEFAHGPPQQLNFLP